MNPSQITKELINQSCGKIINYNNIPKSKKLLPSHLLSKIINCQGLSKMIQNDFHLKIPIIMRKFSIPIKPKLKIISVGNKIDNKIYIDNKIKACKLIGIDYEHKTFSDGTKLGTIEQEIKSSNNDKSVSGVILQLPLTEELTPYSTELLNQISLEKDVDGLNEDKLNNFVSYNQEEFDNCLFNPTALGVMSLIRLCLFFENDVESFRQNHWKYYSLHETLVDFQGKNVCILGHGKTAGLPISLLIQRGKGNIRVCDINTPKEVFEESLSMADIVISAVGKINLVKKENIKNDCSVIDVGINLIPNQTKRRICGDVDFFECIEKVKYISSVPGGVGKMTVIMLIRNVIKSWLIQNNIDGENADMLFVKDDTYMYNY